jgi:hypothetical protein
MKSLNVLFLGLIALSVGCVKQHPLDNSQSDKARIAKGELVSISSLKATYVIPSNVFEDVSPTSTDRPEISFYNLDASSFTAQTKGEIEPSGMSVVNEVVVSTGVEKIRFLDKVNFETNAPLLKNNTDKVDFLGKPNKTYEIKYKLTPTALVMMKIVKEEEITHHELPYSDNLGNGTYAVPLGGYSISLTKRQRVLNNDNDKTNRYEYVPARLVFNEDGSLNLKCRDCADFIDLRPNDEGFTKFSAILDKKDVYPAEYFTGEWYFSEGVVNTKAGSETDIGLVSGSFDADFRNASKIKLFRTAGAIKGYNIAIDEELGDDNTLQLSPVISIPVEGKNYKLSDTGPSAQLAEQEITNISVEQAPYVKMNFEGLSTIQTILQSKFSILGNIGTTSAGILKEVVFGKDSFSLTFEDVTNGKRLRYSFLKVTDRNYQARRHYKEDRKIFGYFPTLRTRLRRAAEDYREEDFEKNILIQRHNPNKDVVFYFSELTPKDNNGKCRAIGDDTLGPLLDSKGEINYREIGRRAVKYWDIAFKAAGAANKVVLHEVNEEGRCFNAPLGDLQFNSINMIDTIQATNLLGVGPSLVDPYTGEVINTTMNVHISPFRSIVSGAVRAYLSSRLGLFKDRSNRLSKSITSGSTILGKGLDTFEGIRDVLQGLIPKDMRRYVAELYHFGQYDRNRDLNNLSRYGAINGNQVFDFFTNSEDFSPDSKESQLVQMISDRILKTDQLVLGEKYSSGQIRTLGDYNDRLRLIEKYRPDFYRSRMMSESISALASLNSMDTDIREKCPEVQAFVDQKLAQAQASGAEITITSAEDYPIVKTCMNKLIPEKILATVIHEMGHNLGLRHNFYGSADPKNFFTRDEVKKLYDVTIESDLKLPHSSTVMEYIPSDKDRLYFPGHYDIAAIRYGYANKVEVDSTDRPNLAKNIRPLTGNTQATNSGPEGSIVKNQSEIGKIRPYRYCTDHEVGLDFDPMCQMHDYGTTPEEVVDGLINDYYESLVVYGTRYDRSGLGSSMGRINSLYRLKRFYDEWRYKLADHLGVGNEYLDKFDKASYAKKLSELKNDASFSGKDYLVVREKIFKFLTDVAFLNNKYCVTIDPITQQPFMLELEKARIYIRSKAPDAIIANCEDSEGLVLAYIKSLGLEYIGDTGFSLNDYKFKVDGIEAFDDALDVTGTFSERLYAAVFLTERSQRYPGLLQKIQPNMMDEPDLYEGFESLVLNRVLNGANLGLDISLLGQNNPQLGINIPENAELRLDKFEAEGPLLNLMMSLLENGVNNPFVDSSARSTKYGRFVDNLSQQDIQSLREEGGLAIPVASGRYLIIRKENQVSMALAKAYSSLSQKVGYGFFIQSQVTPEKNDLASRTTLKLEDAISDLPDVVANFTAEDYVAFGSEFDRIFNSDTSEFFESNLAQMITMNELGPYSLFFKGLLDAIKARTEAGVDVADLQAELTKRLAQVNADIPGFFASAEKALKEQLGDKNYKAIIPLKTEMQQKFAQLLPQTIDALFNGVAETQRDYSLNQEEYMSHFRLLQGILLGQGGAELGAQLVQSALTRSDVSAGQLDTPGQRFMEKYFPDNYVENMTMDGYFLKHLEEMQKKSFEFEQIPLKLKSQGLQRAKFQVQL